MGKPFTLVQVSDTHLSQTHAYFLDNWRVFVDEMRALKPDLIVHSGDVSFNGPARSDDLAFARAQFEDLPCDVLALAGNHDIGEAPRFSRLDQPINDERIAAWRAQFGQMWWRRDIPGWRLIGLDTALMASGRPEESAQLAFLEESLATRGARESLVFMHMPPFYDDPDDMRFDSLCIPHEAREPLFERLAAGGATRLSCGHVHMFRALSHRGVEITWAPTTAMVDFRKQHVRWGVWPRPGYLIWRLDGAQAACELVEPRLMVAQDVARWTEQGGTTTNMPERRVSAA